ncbi:MAG: signal peptidase II [Alphaproteobacteria bacterium]|nr:MAG: signal peptidase II [Alphaproteobacteria bacterium]
MADPTPQTDCHGETIASTCPPTTEEGRRPSFSRLAGLLLALVILIADRVSKLWFLAHWRDAGVLTLAPVLDFRLVWNPGISLGLLQDGGTAITVVTALITAAVAVWLWRVRDRGEALALGLVLGGALGNLWDRLHYGAVVDFVHFHVGDWSFYVFNLADAALSVGAGAMILLSLRQMRRAGRQQPG